MLSKICVHAGDVYIPRLSDQDVDVFVYERSSKSSLKTRCSFKEKKHYSKSLDSSDLNVAWYGIANVGNFYTNLKMVLLVLQFDTGKLCFYSCSDSITSCDIHELTCYDFEPIASVENREFFITDGPTIVAFDPLGFRLLCPLYDIGKKYDLSSEFSAESCKQELLLFNCVADDLTHKGYALLYIFVIRSTNLETEESIIKIFGALWDSNTHCAELFIVSSVYFFPHFEDPVSALHINFLHDVKFLPDMDSEFSIDDVPWWSNSTILCTNAKVMVLNKGCITYQCDIPFSDVRQVTRLKPDMCEQYIFLQSSSGICCCSVKKDAKKLECVKSWNGAQYTLFGDFYRNGSMQVLMLYDDSFECWQVDCCILQHYSFLQSLSTDKEEIPEEHQAATISGLCSRITAGKIAIAKAYSKIAEKNAAIIDVLDRINNRTSTDIPDAENARGSLVDIIVNKDDSQNPHRSTYMKHEELALSVISQWKIFLGSKCILGWTLFNSSESALANISVTIIHGESNLTYKQRVFNHDWQAEQFLETEKNQVEPEETVSVVVEMPMPSFTTETIELTCIISWTIGGGDCRKEVFFGGDGIYPRQQKLFHVPVLLEELLEKKLNKECSEVQRLMSHRISQEGVFLKITTVTSESVFLDDGAIDESILYIPQFKQENGHRYLIFEDERSPLYSINMSVKRLDSSTILTKAYVREVSEAVLLVQWLYSVLPSDAVVVPIQYLEDESCLKKKLLIAMKEEIDLIRAYFASAAKDAKECEDSEMVGESEDSSGGTKIVLPKETYLQMRKELMKKEFVTDSIAVKLSQM